ncbi:MAG: hypothetical protein JKX94_00095 [Sneathiella sp.]|nr:hypothetical protein [Sneathiella sp.]
MTEKQLKTSYRTATPYFPERNLRKEVKAVIAAVARSMEEIRSSKKAKFLSNTHRVYNEDRFISRIVSRVLSSTRSLT